MVTTKIQNHQQGYLKYLLQNTHSPIYRPNQRQGKKTAQTIRLIRSLHAKSGEHRQSFRISYNTRQIQHTENRISNQMPVMQTIMAAPKTAALEPPFQRKKVNTCKKSYQANWISLFYNSNLYINISVRSYYIYIPNCYTVENMIKSSQ